MQYGEGAVTARHKLTGGRDTEDGNHYLTVDAVRRAVRTLKNQNADTIDGSYVGIVHPDCAYDLMSDPKWVNVKTYSDPEGIYEGEIGRIEGVRFVESTEAKIFHAENLTGAARSLTVKTTLSSANATVSVTEAISAAEAAALSGRCVILNGTLYTVSSAAAGAAGNASVTMTGTVSAADGVAGRKIYPGEAGAEGRDVYATLILGADAYGTTEITGGGLEHIVKQLGSAGTGDPLNQRASCGWKATKAATRLVEAYMVRIETASTFEAGSN